MKRKITTLILCVMLSSLIGCSKDDESLQTNSNVSDSESSQVGDTGNGTTSNESATSSTQTTPSEDHSDLENEIVTLLEDRLYINLASVNAKTSSVDPNKIVFDIVLIGEDLALNIEDILDVFAPNIDMIDLDNTIIKDDTGIVIFPVGTTQPDGTSPEVEPPTQAPTSSTQTSSTTSSTQTSSTTSSTQTSSTTSTPVAVPNVNTSMTLPAGNLSDWNLILLNHGAENKIDSELVFEKTKFDTQYIDSRAGVYYKQMCEAAAKEGITLYLRSGYRSMQTQTVNYNANVERLQNQGNSKEEAIRQTNLYYTVPGHSEHHTGLAFDIITPEYHKDVYTLNEQFAQTDAYAWLLENCADYGFILRYEKHKTDITAINFEPWHYRYVGVEHAQYIMANDICFEEYIALLKANGR